MFVEDASYFVVEGVGDEGDFQSEESSLVPVLSGCSFLLVCLLDLSVCPGSRVAVASEFCLRGGD